MKTIRLPDWLGNQKKWQGTLSRKFRNTPYYCVSLKQGFECHHGDIQGIEGKKKPGPGYGSLICYISNIFINLSLS